MYPPPVLINPTHHTSWICGLVGGFASTYPTICPAIYLHFTFKINHSWIGKYTVRRMDPSWDKTWQSFFWSNCIATSNDRFAPKRWLSTRNPPFSGKSRLVKYCSIWPDFYPNLAAVSIFFWRTSLKLMRCCALWCLPYWGAKKCWWSGCWSQICLGFTLG